MAHARAPRISAEQWQALIDQWRTSGLSAEAFCQDQGVSYARFGIWRKRLLKTVAPPEAETSFIDLASLTAAAPTRGWNIVLSLGNGVELRLSQG
jgi:putative transposase